MLQKMTAVGNTKRVSDGLEGKYAEFGRCEDEDEDGGPVWMMLLYLALRLGVLILLLSCSVNRVF